MTTEKMNIHRALIELKTIGKRIGDEISATTFVVENKHSNTKISGKPIAEAEHDIKSSMQKIEDLIRRRNAIKCAVTRSNSTETVTVCGKTYTVAEAIDMKNNGTAYLGSLLRKLSLDYNRAKSSCDMNNHELDHRADEHLATLFGAKEVKAGVSKEMTAARNAFVEAQTMELLDPCDAASKMQELRDTIDNFLSEVDAALSVSNAVTEITVEY